VILSDAFHFEDSATSIFCCYKLKGRDAALQCPPCQYKGLRSASCASLEGFGGVEEIDTASVLCAVAASGQSGDLYIINNPANVEVSEGSPLSTSGDRWSCVRQLWNQLDGVMELPNQSSAFFLKFVSGTMHTSSKSGLVDKEFGEGMALKWELKSSTNGTNLAL
jgi:hypothetical protein